ncbi:MAG: hypothetical protein DMG23_09690 [Acidobacteria bacterium]|nr:MAG: hypothetical protein DMG23_09690 [Acidobacteriota bacterium]
MSNDVGLTNLEKLSIIATLAMAVLLGILAWASAHNNWLLWLAVSVGALGGLAHEIAQSGGKIMFFQRHQDGMYLGSLAGMVLGAVAGILVIRGHLVSTANGTALSVSMVQLDYEIFTAGLALKGVTEAAGGRAVP